MNVIVLPLLLALTSQLGPYLISWVDVDPYATLSTDQFIALDKAKAQSWRGGSFDFIAQQLFSLPDDVIGKKLLQVLVATLGEHSEWSTDSFTVSIVLPMGGGLEGKAGGHAVSSKFVAVDTEPFNLVGTRRLQIAIQVHPEGGYDDFSPYIAAEKNPNLADESLRRGLVSSIVFHDATSRDCKDLGFGDFAYYLIFGEKISSINKDSQETNHLDLFFGSDMKLPLPKNYGNLLIVDLRGRVVYNEKIHPLMDMRRFSALPKGIYPYTWFWDKGTISGKLWKLD